MKKPSPRELNKLVKRKSQIEIMGLVMIVLIITVVFLFSVTLRVKSKLNPTRNTFANDQLATNFLLALLKTDHVECETTLETLIRDCAGEKKIRCTDDQDACFHIDKTLAEILPNSLGIMQTKYSLHITKMPENLELLTYEDSCGPKQNKGMQGYQPISLYPKPGRVDVTLDVCK